MLDEKVVSYDEGAKLAKEYGIDFFECSAKNDIEVENSFISIARGVKDRIIADGSGPTGNKGIDFRKDAKPKSNGCCK